MGTGVNTSTIIYVRNREKPPKGKNCSKCTKMFKGYCKEFSIRITDNTNAKICSKYNENSKYKGKQKNVKSKKSKRVE